MMSLKSFSEDLESQLVLVEPSMLLFSFIECGRFLSILPTVFAVLRMNLCS